MFDLFIQQLTNPDFKLDFDYTQSTLIYINETLTSVNSTIRIRKVNFRHRIVNFRLRIVNFRLCNKKYLFVFLFTTERHRISG